MGRLRLRMSSLPKAMAETRLKEGTSISADWSLSHYTILHQQLEFSHSKIISTCKPKQSPEAGKTTLSSHQSGRFQGAAIWNNNRKTGWEVQEQRNHSKDWVSDSNRCQLSFRCSARQKRPKGRKITRQPSGKTDTQASWLSKREWTHKAILIVLHVGRLYGRQPRFWLSRRMLRHSPPL